MLVALEVIIAQQVGNPKLMLILREKSGTRATTCDVDHSVLREIFLALHKVDEKRAGTYAVWSSLMQSCNIQLEQFALHALDDEGGITSSLLIRQGDRLWSLQCRLYDGIALALRCGAPILCEESVLAVLSAGIEINITEEPATKDIDERLKLFTATHADIPKA